MFCMDLKFIEIYGQMSFDKDVRGERNKVKMLMGSWLDLKF